MKLQRNGSKIKIHLIKRILQKLFYFDKNKFSLKSVKFHTKLANIQNTGTTYHLQAQGLSIQNKRFNYWCAKFLFVNASQQFQEE